MTGLECGHRYVDDPGLSWKDWLEDYVPRWWQQLKSAARSDFHELPRAATYAACKGIAAYGLTAIATLTKQHATPKAAIQALEKAIQHHSAQPELTP